jgi:putative redox protein
MRSVLSVEIASPSDIGSSEATRDLTQVQLAERFLLWHSECLYGLRRHIKEGKVVTKNMEVSATYLSDSSLKVIARGHGLICDQPSDEGGSNAGMSPSELLLASVASCAAYHAAQYLDTRGLSARQLTVRVNADKASQPSRLTSFRIDITVPGLNERHQAAIVRSVKTCLIPNTLSLGPAIEVSMNATASARALAARG